LTFAQETIKILDLRDLGTNALKEELLNILIYFSLLKFISIEGGAFSTAAGVDPNFGTPYTIQRPYAA
jgi:hypothetical protein